MIMVLIILCIIVLMQLYSWYWDYSHTRNRSNFFNWLRFRQAIVLTSLVGGSLLVANLFFPAVALETAEEKIAFGERFDRKDLALKGYMQQGLQELDNVDVHFKVMDLLAFQYRNAPDYAEQMKLRSISQKYFLNLERNTSKVARDMGYIGKAWQLAEEGQPSEAVDALRQTRTSKQKYYHLCMGKVMVRTGNMAAAEKQYEAEIELDGANEEAWKRLIQIYDYSGRTAELDSMLAMAEVVKVAPREIAARHFFNKGDWISYYAMVLKRFRKHFDWFGALAAFAIMLVWLVYLLRVDVFKPTRWHKVAAVVLLGMVFSFGVESISDFIQLRLDFRINGHFFNDFLYCVIGIGAVEELVKIAPLLLIMAFGKKLQEPFDYLLYAAASALGFAFIENLLYINAGDLDNIQGRALMAVVSHMFDSSLIAYCIVLARFRYQRSPLLGLAIGFGLAALAHGFYDFWLIYGRGALTAITFIFFLATLHLWGTIQNNALNQSPWFNTNKVVQNNNLQFFLVSSLSALIMLEYLVLGWNYGLGFANKHLVREFMLGGYLIFYLASSVSKFDFVRGYWAPFRLPASPFIPVSASAQNYVGYKLRLIAFPRNKLLNPCLPMDGLIINRVVLGTNPNYFLVQLDKPIDIIEHEPHYVLLRIRNPFEAINEMDPVIAGVRAIRELDMLQQPNLKKADFPFAGYIKVLKTGTEVVVNVSPELSRARPDDELLAGG